MKTASFGSIILLLAAGLVSGQSAGSIQEIRRVDASPSDGFNYAYYLYIPKAMRDVESSGKVASLIVIPNNTGKLDDDIAFHDDDVKKRMGQVGPYLTSVGLAAPVLMPVFPRPASEHRHYTHSLDRDTMTADKKEYHRLDLQLIAMIADARSRLRSEGVPTQEKVVMQGYSASGMFVNRFVFMHPELVKAAIVGAPGGWAIAPVSRFNKKELTYPAGVADIKALSGKKFDLKRVREVRLLMVLGAEDTNDAVPMGDAYDKRETDLVISLFGKTPVDRWSHTVKLYREVGLNAEFKLYPATGHQMSTEMRDDMVEFLKKHN
jgi:predicted esterase